MNEIRKHGIRRWLGLALAMAAFSQAGWAELGGGVESVQADQTRMLASRQVRQADGYTVHEMQTKSGVVVREYASPSGSVFGISWHGPYLPDLRQLLGEQRFAEYQQALQAQSAKGGLLRRGPVSVVLPDLVVQMSGHSRAFHGAAYLPQTLPAGVQAGAIR